LPGEYTAIGRGRIATALWVNQKLGIAHIPVDRVEVPRITLPFAERDARIVDKQLMAPGIEYLGLVNIYHVGYHRPTWWVMRCSPRGRSSSCSSWCPPRRCDRWRCRSPAQDHNRLWSLRWRGPRRRVSGRGMWTPTKWQSYLWFKVYWLDKQVQKVKGAVNDAAAGFKLNF